MGAVAGSGSSTHVFAARLQQRLARLTHYALLRHAQVALSGKEGQLLPCLLLRAAAETTLCQQPVVTLHVLDGTHPF